MGLGSERSLDHEAVRLGDQLVERYGGGAAGTDLLGLDVRVVGADPHAEPGGARGDRPRDGAERQQPEDLAAQPVDRRAGLPLPDAGARRGIAGYVEERNLVFLF